MYNYGELLIKAKESNMYSKEEWFKIFGALLNVKNKEQFDMDWEYSKCKMSKELKLKTNREIILDYCANVQTGDIDHLQKCIDAHDALNNTSLDHKELSNRLDGSCPSSMGLDNHIGLCYGTANNNLSNQNKYDLCKRCWEDALKINHED